MALTEISVAHPSSSASIEDLYLRHRDQVFRMAMRYAGGDRAWAEDVTQDVFIKLCQTIDSLARTDALDGWLYRVTANICLNRLKRDRFLRAPPVRWLLSDRRQPTTPEAQTTARDDLSRAMQTVQSLPPKEQVAFCMYHLDGREQAEIGELLGHSKGYVCKLIQRAEQRVRKRGWRVGDE